MIETRDSTTAASRRQIIGTIKDQLERIAVQRYPGADGDMWEYALVLDIFEDVKGRLFVDDRRGLSSDPASTRDLANRLGLEAPRRALTVVCYPDDADAIDSPQSFAEHLIRCFEGWADEI